MDFENNGQSVTNFMHKIKKQAKRLFQLSKTTNNNLEIKSLSQAQELLAKINGYPDWHALETHISNSKTILQKENEKNITLSKYPYDNIFYLKTESAINTFFRINSINENINQIENSINLFLDMFSFQLNMNLHEVSLVVEQKNHKYKKESSYSLYNISKSFNLSEDEAKKLFYIDKSHTTSFEDNELTIYILITSSVKNEKEHIDICLSMKQVFPELESLNSLDENQLNNFELKDGISNLKVTEKLFNKQNNISKYVYLINFLINKNIDYICKYSLKDKEFLYKFSENQKELVEGLINGILNTDKYKEQELIYKSKPFINYIDHNDNNGLSLLSKITKKVFNYNHMSNSRVTNVDLIYGKPGTGKSILTNMITLSSVLDKDLKNIPRIAIVDVGPSSQGLLSVVKNLSPIEMNHQVKYIKYGSLNEKNDIVINPLDLPLGKRKYDYYEINRITPIIAGFFSEKTEGITMLISYLIGELNKKEEKLYVSSVNKEVDKKLLQLNFIPNEKTTWYDIVDFLFSNNEIMLAKKAQVNASFIIGDLITSDHPDIFKNIRVSTGENIIQYFNRIIVDGIAWFRALYQPTNIFLDDEKIVTIDLSNVDLQSSNSRFINLGAFVFMNVVEFLKQNLLGYDKYANFDFPNTWQGDWKSYLGKDSLEKVYNYYHYQQYRNNNYNMSKLMIDEYHRFSNNKNVEYFILDTIRSGRKNNIAISICSQSLDDFKNIKDFSTGFFTSTVTESESLKLIDLGFNKNEIKMIKEMTFPSWAIGLTTNRGKVFDIVKLEMTEYLKFAFSTLSEDIYVKELLSGKYDYFTLLEKCVKFLNERHEKYGFKIIIEKMKEEGLTDNYIKKYLLENI